MNGLAGLVNGRVDFYVRGMSENGDWLVYEYEPEEPVLVENGKGDYSLKLPETIKDYATDKDYAIEDLSDVEIWAGLWDVVKPIEIQYFNVGDVTPEWLDTYGDEMYWETFKVADLTLGETYDVVFDIVHNYDAINEDDFVVRVVDRNGRGIEGADVYLWDVLKGVDADYALDENGDYIVDEEESDPYFVGTTDARGIYTIDADQKQTAAAHLGTDDDAVEIVGALRAEYEDEDGEELETSTTFVNFAAENNKALIVMSAPDTEFKVTVVTRDDDRPFYALPGATVRIVENVGELWGAPAMGETLAERTTNANGEVVFTNVELTNVIQRNFPDFDVDDDDDLKLVIEDLIRNNWLVVEKAGYTPVERLVTDVEIEEGEAIVALFPTTMDFTKFVDRIDGQNRFATAVEIAKRTFPAIPNTFILASGEDFPDALVANGLTNAFNAPILLTRQGELPQDTADYLAEAKKVHDNLHIHIVGGPLAIDGAVENTLEKEFNATTSRMAGQNRYKTAAAVARYMLTHGEAVGWTFEALVANGQVFPDAIIASLPAAQYGKPILLTTKANLHPVTADVLRNDTLMGFPAYTHAVVVGGEEVISKDTYAEMNMVTKERLWGHNRYLTSLEALRQMYPDATKLYVVSGAQYTDALVASKLAADNNAAILLVNPVLGLSAEAEAYLRESEITDITVVGGELAMPNAVLEQLAQIVLSR
ncbi:MAG: cell wall-binding repeat-containing protein [Peptoniphilaceae bacterium]